MQIGLKRYNAALGNCSDLLECDPTCSVIVYLYRARAYKGLNSILHSIKDYRKYISSQPKPSDAQEVEQEMDALLASACGEEDEVANGRPLFPAETHLFHNPKASEEKLGEEFNDIGEFKC